MSGVESVEEPRRRVQKKGTQTARKMVHPVGGNRARSCCRITGQKKVSSTESGTGRVLAPLNQVKSSTSNKSSNESQIITLEKWADDDQCDLFKPSDPELQDVQVYHPCLVTASSDLIIKCYENEEKLKNGEKPVGIIPCESKMMARRFSFFEAIVREGSNWRESQNSTSSASKLMNQITIKSENSNQTKNSQTSTQNSSIKQVTSLFNPEKLCDFIKSLVSRKIEITSENCLDYLEMTVFYQNSELEKNILNKMKTLMNTELALAVWQVPEAAELRDDSIVFFKNNPKGLKYDFLSTIPVENLMILLCELSGRKDRSKIIDDHEFDCLIQFCMNVQTKKIPGFEKLFDVYEKRQTEKIEAASKTPILLDTPDKSSSKRKRTELNKNSNDDDNNNETHLFKSCDFTHLFFKNITKKDYESGTHLKFMSEGDDEKVIGINREGHNFPANNRTNNTYFNLYSPDFPKNKKKYVWQFQVTGQTTHKRSFIFGLCKTEGIAALPHKPCGMPYKLTPSYFDRKKNRTQIDFHGFCLNRINNFGIDSLETIEMDDVNNDNKKFEEIKYLYKSPRFTEKPPFDNEVVNAGVTNEPFRMDFKLEWVPDTQLLTLKQIHKDGVYFNTVGLIGLTGIKTIDQKEKFSMKVNARNYDKFIIGLQGTPEIKQNTCIRILGPGGSKPGTQIKIFSKKCKGR